MSQSLQNNQQTFIYKGTEVVKTGRIAEKEIQAAGARTRSRKDRLYEVKPLNEQDGTWAEWVRNSDLYEVIS